jgi:hypothetical protein
MAGSREQGVSLRPEDPELRLIKQGWTNDKRCKKKDERRKIKDIRH